MDLNPAEYVIYKLGGVRPLSRLLNISHSAVSRWQESGLIPASRHMAILEIAKQNRVKITPANLTYGGSIKK